MCTHQQERAVKARVRRQRQHPPTCWCVRTSGMGPSAYPCAAAHRQGLRHQRQQRQAKIAHMHCQTEPCAKAMLGLTAEVHLLCLEPRQGSLVPTKAAPPTCPCVRTSRGGQSRLTCADKGSTRPPAGVYAPAGWGQVRTYVRLDIDTGFAINANNAKPNLPTCTAKPSHVRNQCSD